MGVLNFEHFTNEVDYNFKVLKRFVDFYKANN